MVPGTDDHELPRESVVPDTTGVRMRCPDCGAEFPRSEVATPEKGRLACPDCGGTDIEERDRPTGR
jgi:predicted RNA-binding Zn-ribbon protein involved in translation (DUF1610 family)